MEADLQQLWESYERTRSDVDLNALVVAYTPFVQRIIETRGAKIPKNRMLDEGDLLTAGQMGLMTAISRYERARGWPFTTFAYRRVWGAMVDEIRRLDWIPRLSRARAKTEPIEFAQMQSLTTMLSREGDVRDVTLSQAIADKHAPRPDERLEHLEWADTLGLRWTDQERHILVGYYQQEKLLRQIGEELGLSESRISQMHSAIIRRLRIFKEENEMMDTNGSRSSTRCPSDEATSKKKARRYGISSQLLQILRVHDGATTREIFDAWSGTTGKPLDQSVCSLLSYLQRRGRIWQDAQSYWRLGPAPEGELGGKPPQLKNADDPLLLYLPVKPEAVRVVFPLSGDNRMQIIMQRKCTAQDFELIRSLLETAFDSLVESPAV